MYTIKEEGKEPLEIESMPNSQKVEAPRVSIDKRTEKPNVVHTHNGTLFILKKEGDSDICCNMDIKLSEISQSQSNKFC